MARLRKQELCSFIDVHHAMEAGRLLKEIIPGNWEVRVTGESAKWVVVYETTDRKGKYDYYAIGFVDGIKRMLEGLDFTRANAESIL